MNIHPIGPAFPTFGTDIANATSEVRTALDNMPSADPRVRYIVDPMIPVHAHLDIAHTWLNDAVIHPGVGTPSAAVQFATEARAEVEDGLNLITHRLNGPVNTGSLRTSILSALQLLDRAAHVPVLFAH